MSAIVAFPFPSLFAKDQHCVCFRPGISVFEPRWRLQKQRSVKNVRWWPMAMFGSGQKRLSGFLTSSHLDLRSGETAAIDQSCRCHRRAGGRACRRAAQPGGWPLSRWVLPPGGSPPRDCEQLRLEYPERMPTIRPSKVIGLPWDWWRFAWCYQLWRKSGRLSGVRTSRGQEWAPLP